MRRWLLLCFFLPVFALLNAQGNYFLNGTLSDDAGEPIVGGSVMLLQEADSILQSFSLSNAQGKFKFDGVPAGKYILKAMYSKHDPVMQVLDLNGDNKTLDVGTLTMTPQATKVEEVVITDERIPVRIKGDSIEYDAKAFKTQPNDNVEELIKKLPGMEVDAEGNIKAQGEKVTKILVDGKEFFGDDPKVASKNLPADAIDKVQVFDKMSDVSEFTGMDDGQRTRTINLALKEDRKTGYFGNVMAGYGSKERYESKANLNRFGKKSQLSVLGQLNNTNQQGFTFQDYMSFVGGVRNLMNGDGTRSGDLGLNLSSDPTNGFFTTGAGGFNGNFDFSEKSQLTLSYFYNYLEKDIARQAWKQTVLEDGTYLTEEDGTQSDQNSNHRLSLYWKQSLDSMTRLSLRTTGSLNNTNSLVQNLSSSSTPGGAANSSLQNYQLNGGLNNLNNVLNLMHRYKKRGRNTTLNASFEIKPQDKEARLRSENSFFLGSMVNQDTLFQNQTETTGTINFGGKVTHTEPIGTRYAIEGYVSHQENRNDLDKNFFDLNPLGEDPVLNTNLSNAYEARFQYQQAGLNWKYYTKKTTLTTGAALQNSQLDGQLLATGATIEKDFFNLLPFVSLRFAPKRGQNLRFSYQTRINAPSITQLQPVPDNSNPLNIVLGNPDLKAEYAHSTRLSFNHFDQFSFASMFFMFNGTYTKNRISTMTTVDSLLRQVSQPVNVDQDINLTGFASFSSPIRKLKIKASLDLNTAINRSIVFINARENFVNRFTNGGTLKIENRKKDLFDLQGGLRMTYGITTYPDAAQLNQNYLNSTYFAEASVFLPKGFILMTGIDYSQYLGAGFQGSQTVPLWRAYVSKKVFKNQRGLLKIAAFDLLNRNVGINRTAQLNYLQEERINTLSRYFLGSFSYAIVSVGKKR